MSQNNLKYLKSKILNWIARKLENEILALAVQFTMWGLGALTVPLTILGHMDLWALTAPSPHVRLFGPHSPSDNVRSARR